MYRSCIFCSANLGSNDSLERFPVGRSIAFDSEKGRLWAVCPRCARWNLAPLEERWEAIEDGERLFRDTRARAQRENVGLAKLRDGTRLIRVGQALPAELALWRYGETLEQRRRRYRWIAGAATVAGASLPAAFVVGAVVAAAGVSMLAVGHVAVQSAVGAVQDRKTIYHGRVEGVPVRMQYRDLAAARLRAHDDAVELVLPTLAPDGTRTPLRRLVDGGPSLVVRGPEARRAMGRAMVHVNRAGAGSQAVAFALDAIRRAGSAEEMLRSAARQRVLLNGSRIPHTFAPPGSDYLERSGYRSSLNQSAHPVTALALEMALHEETERQALDGELSMLEAMWREAEEIAAIADRLPDHLPPAGPPRT